MRTERRWNIAEGDGDRGVRIALLVARFNNMVTEQLMTGARDRLLAEGIPEDRIAVFRVPGAWELPQAARRIVRSGLFDAVVAIGCVIRGETPHFDYVAGNASEGLGKVALDAEIPVVFGVLTTHDAEQAMSRCDVFGANRGSEFAEAALAMIEFCDRLGTPHGRPATPERRDAAKASEFLGSS